LSKNELLQNELKIIPTKGLPLRSKWKLIYLKKKELSPIAAAFLVYVASEKETVYKQYFDWQNEILD
jgi:hypothetical protein